MTTTTTTLSQINANNNNIKNNNNNNDDDVENHVAKVADSGIATSTIARSQICDGDGSRRKRHFSA